MKNSPRVNQDPRSVLIEENLRLKERIRQLEAEVESLRRGRACGCCSSSSSALQVSDVAVAENAGDVGVRKKCSGCSVM